MNANQLLDVIGEVKTDYLFAAMATGEKRPARRNVHKIVLIAAVVSLMVLLLGCAIVALNLQDLKLGEFTYTQPRYIDEEGNKIPATEKTKDVISLQGIVGSPEYMAAQEWNLYEWNIIAKESEQIEDNFDAPAEYDAYFIGNQEMQDKVDELCEKYGLKLLGPMALTQNFEQDIFFDSLGLSGLTRKDAKVIVEDGSGYFYECGNFKLEFWMTLEGEARWPHKLLVSYLYKTKGYFDTVTLSVEDVNSAEQWNYTLGDGTEVLIMNTGKSAWIFCDQEEAFLSAGFGVTYEDENGTVVSMTRQDIEAVAEVLDFTVKPAKPDMTKVKAKLEESMKQHLADEEARAETWVNPFARDYGSYKDVITFMLENADEPKNVYYGLWDLTGDGEAELLIGCADSFGSAKTVVNGKVETLVSNGTDEGFVLCEDRVFLYQNGDYYYFCKAERPNEMVTVDYLEYDAWEECWYTEHKGTRTKLTEEEAMAIIDSYPRVPLEMKPIREYPMD